MGVRGVLCINLVLAALLNLSSCGLFVDSLQIYRLLILVMCSVCELTCLLKSAVSLASVGFLLGHNQSSQQCALHGVWLWLLASC